MRHIPRVLARSEISAVLARPKWTVHDLVDHAAPLIDPPSEEHLHRLSQLAGLDPPTLQMLESFRNQLKFVETLKFVDVEGLEPVTRLVKTVEVPPLDTALDDATIEPELGHWHPAELASERKSDFYVVHDTLHTDQ